MKKYTESESKRNLKSDMFTWEKWLDARFSERHYCLTLEHRRTMDIYDCAVLKQAGMEDVDSGWVLVHAWIADEKEVSDGEAEEVGELVSSRSIRINFCPICGEELALDDDFIVMIEGVTDRAVFFDSLLKFYAPYGVSVTIWGKLPERVQEGIAAFRTRHLSIRRWLFRESEWHLTTDSQPLLSEFLCDEPLLKTLTWALSKGRTPLGLCRAWDDMNLDASEFIDEDTLFGWLDELKAKGIIDSYDKVTD